LNVAPSLWLGPSQNEARAAFERARQAGMSALRSLVVGNIASFKHNWTFRKNLAAKAGCSVRTAQRAITQAVALGLMGVARSKPNEKPPGRENPMPCGFSHRWINGWGKTGEAVKRAVDAARARVSLRRATRVIPESCTPQQAKPCAVRSQREPRRWTAAELDAELDELERESAKREKPPP
jgi:hypothetical protein